MASNLDCICTDSFGCEKHSFYKEAIKKTKFFLLKTKETLAFVRVMNHVHSVTFLHRYIISIDNKFRKTYLLGKRGQSISKKRFVLNCVVLNCANTISMCNTISLPSNLLFEFIPDIYGFIKLGRFLCSVL
jgi:hypothetical protein